MDKIVNRKSAPVDRFWAGVAKTETCWMWTKHTVSGGYGSFGINSRNVRAHRFSYELHKGQIPEGMMVCHRCDVRGCVNPDHLFLGTSMDNVLDMMAKGRQRYFRKINAKDIYMIRKLALVYGVAWDEICAAYGIGRIAVYRALKGQTKLSVDWPHSFVEFQS